MSRQVLKKDDNEDSQRDAIPSWWEGTGTSLPKNNRRKGPPLPSK